MPRTKKTDRIYGLLVYHIRTWIMSRRRFEVRELVRDGVAPTMALASSMVSQLRRRGEVRIVKPAGGSHATYRRAIWSRTAAMGRIPHRHPTQP